jgi:hypothetical protein
MLFKNILSPFYAKECTRKYFDCESITRKRLLSEHFPVTFHPNNMYEAFLIFLFLFIFILLALCEPWAKNKLFSIKQKIWKIPMPFPDYTIADFASRNFLYKLEFSSHWSPRARTREDRRRKSVREICIWIF